MKRLFSILTLACVLGSASVAVALEDDSPEVAGARATMVAQLRKAVKAQLAKIDKTEAELGKAIEAVFKTSIENIEKAKADTVEELKAVAQKEMSDASMKVMDATIAIAEQRLPKRQGAEPKDGEKRDAKAADGSCTTDLEIDMGRFGIESMKFAKKIAKAQLDQMASTTLKKDDAFDLDKDLEKQAEAKQQAFIALVKTSLEGLVVKCDALVDRYGDTAVCKSTTPPNEEVKLADVKEQCEEIRTQVKAIK
ncbi:hypothetical protein K2X33_10600 [bacterium]|nr:hypothetical protein [bacterium]